MPLPRPRRLAGALLLAAVACGGSDSGSTPPTTVLTPATLTIAPVSATMTGLGESRTLVASVADARGTAMPGAAVSWTTSDDATMSLSATTGGSVVVTAHGNGAATITATAPPATAHLDFTVAQQLASLLVQPAAPTIAVGGSQTLTAVALDPQNSVIAGGGATATFLSGSPGVATVDAAGVVRGLAAGSAIVTASVTRAGVTRSASSTVTVGSTTTTYPSTASVQATPQTVFSPASVDVSAGGTVTWVFGTLTHNVTFDPATGVPSNVPSSTSTQVSRTFATPGTFTYECTLHPGMTGQVIVH